jgi:hypothetical protein
LPIEFAVVVELSSDVESPTQGFKMPPRTR